MPWFRCLVRGENFLLRVDDDMRLMGFYTTRYVDASNAETAELAVLASMKAEEFFTDMPASQRNKEARVNFEEIVELGRNPRRKGKGFIFFPMDSDAEVDEAERIERASQE